MRATLHEQLFLLAVTGIVIYLCWNCRIAPSTIILIAVVCAFLFVCACPGMEAFAEVTRPFGLILINPKRSGRVLENSVDLIENQINPNPLEVTGPSTIDYDALMDAGVVRPSVFNCANTIGNTAEESYIYADPKTDM
jgi:hypothetical protein